MTNQEIIESLERAISVLYAFETGDCYDLAIEDAITRLEKILKQYKS